MLPKTVNIDGKALKLQIWDTAGQDHFKNIAANSFRGAKGIIVCYAINDKKSLKKPLIFWCFIQIIHEKMKLFRAFAKIK